MAAGASALRLVACVHAMAPRGKIWHGDRAGRCADPRASVGKHVGAKLGRRLSSGCAAERRSWLRSHGNSEGAKHRPGGDGEIWRAIVPVAWIRPVAENVLGAVDVYA